MFFLDAPSHNIKSEIYHLYHLRIEEPNTLCQEWVERIPGSVTYYAKLVNLPASKGDMERFMQKTGQIQ